MTPAARITQFVRLALNVLLGTIIAVLLGVMSMQIVFRYGFNASLIWAEEACRHLLIWVSFLAAFAAYERGEIAAVTMLRNALPRRAGLALALFANALALGLLAFLVVYGMRYAERIGSQPIPALQFAFDDLGLGWTVPSMFWVYVALPVGMALLALRIAADMVTCVRLWRSGGHAHDLDASEFAVRTAGDKPA